MLYKYFPLARRDVIENGLLRFTQPGDFNDPFELHPSFDLMSKADIATLPQAPENPNMRVLTPQALQPMITAVLPGLTTVMQEHSGMEGAFSLNNNRLAQATFDSKFGVLCLTESPDSLLMWAHYADSHKGFVLQFDEHHDFFAPTTVDGQAFELTKIEYTDKRPVLSYSTINSPSVYYRKSPEWSYEREWRLIKPLKDAARVIEYPRYPRCLFSLPASSVTGVIVGLAVPDEERVRLFELFSQPHLQHVTVYQTALSKDEYKIEVHPPLDGMYPPDALNGKVCEAR